MEVASNIKTGSVWINNHNAFDAATGFGGYKESGYGRDGGKEGLYEYVKPKWQSRAKVDVSGFDHKTFGGAVFPTVGAANGGESTTGDVPDVDRTYKLYVNGKQARPDANYSRPVIGKDSKVIAQVGEANRKDIRNAVEAAVKAQPGWQKRTAHNRAQIMYYLAENMELRKEEFVQSLLTSLACSTREKAETEVDACVQRLFHWAAYADKYGGSVQETQQYGTVLRVHDAVGTVAIICPPEQNVLLSFISLFAPALVRGNAVIIIPSEKYPLPALQLYQVLETSDVPPGVLNILTGSQDHMTKYLTEHRNINAVWYFGSTQGSAFVEHASADSIKRTWTNYGESRDWMDAVQGAGEEFLLKSVECKSVWIPMGHTFAN